MRPPLFLFRAILLASGMLAGSGAAWAGLEQLIPLGDLDASAIPLHAVGPGASVGSIAYVAVTDSEHGTELWRSNGSVVTLHRDVRPGPESGQPTQLTPVGNNVVYVADDGVHGPELFTTSSIYPTGLLADLQPGRSHPAPAILGASLGFLWFTTPATSSHPSQRDATDLWVTDGVSNPVKLGFYARDSITRVSVMTTRPTLLFLARPHGAPSGILDFIQVTANGPAAKIDTLRTQASVALPSSPVYAATPDFVCYQSIDTNREPMIYHFSLGFRQVLREIMPGAADSQPEWFVSNGVDRVCFTATSAEEGREVWTTLGFPGSTVLMADVVPGAVSAQPSQLLMAQGGEGVFFQVQNGSGRDLYHAIQSQPATLYATHIQASSQQTVVSAREIAYVIPDGPQFKVQLADGVSVGGISLGPTFTSPPRLQRSSAPSFSGSWFYVIGATAAQGEELYYRQGASLSPIYLATAPATDSSRPRHFFPYGNAEQIFVADTSSTQGRLFRLDNGSVSSLALNKPSDVFSSNASSHPDEFTEVADALFFTARDGNQRRLFASSDGSSHGVSAMAGVYEPEQLTVFQDRLYLLAHANSGSTGFKQVYEVKRMSGGLVLTLLDHSGHYATALLVAAGRLFFVEPTGSGTERLQCLRSDWTLAPPMTFDLDSSGLGITQLTAAGGKLFLSAMKEGQRVLWSTDGTMEGTTVPPGLITHPQILGVHAGACLFWHDLGNQSSYRLWRWNGEALVPAAMVFEGPITDTPEPNRLLRRPAGVEVAGQFYFATQSGRLFETDGDGVTLIFNEGSLKVLPESLTALPDKVLFMAVSRNYDCRLLSFSESEGIQGLWFTSLGSLPCPLTRVGSRWFFTVGELDFNIGSTALWQTDGTVSGTQSVLADLAPRELSGVSMGAFRGHLVLAGVQVFGGSGLEPAVLNHMPVLPTPALLRGGRRGQPFAFEYDDIVLGAASDADGDPTSPLQLFNASGTLTCNGVEVPISTFITPGDEFVWTPPAGTSGALIALILQTSDGWQDGMVPVIIEVKAPYDLWRENYFTAEELEDPAITAPEADANGNGVPNGLEQLFGRDPKLADATPGWIASLAYPLGSPMHRFTFTRLALLPEGSVLVVERSGDLDPWSWTSIARKEANEAWEATVTVTEIPLPDGRVQVHVDTPFTSEGIFLRLKAEL